jgi:hypothetical protein
MQILKINKDKERIDKILKLWIFKVANQKLSILSYKCITTKQVLNDSKQFKNWFPFNHQVFWFSLMEMKDLDFAISETKRVLEWERQYLFPNGAMVQLDVK